MDKNQFLYEMLEVKYLKMFSREVTTDLSVNEDLYPRDWFGNQDYEKKISILIEALENKKKIVDTKGYQSIVEGVEKSR